jgi:hypothetical protein
MPAPDSDARDMPKRPALQLVIKYKAQSRFLISLLAATPRCGLVCGLIQPLTDRLAYWAGANFARSTVGRPLKVFFERG